MTSKRFFFKVLREDMRHKTWMLALSALSSFLMIMVVWLIWWSNQRGIAETVENGLSRFEADSRAFAVRETISFFGEFVTIMGGTVAIFGAVITGLFGFRYVFHKNMADVYHSLPVKRGTLFAAGALNGFLIWFVPFLVFFLPTVALAAGFLNSLGASGEFMGALAGTAALTVAALVTAFLLVYGLTLTAVMLSGNILNTLVNMGILGFGAISVYGLVYAFFLNYMDRFLDSWDWNRIPYASPLFSAPVLLYRRAVTAQDPGAFFMSMAVNLCLAAALLACAWRLYRHRASELAERGTKNRAAMTLMRIVAGTVAGMGGWFLFMALTNDQTVLWGIFGLAFGGILCLGVLDIIFAMDFKAFFVHKCQMGAVLGAVLLVCFGFCWDWAGYDDYLPKKENIAEIGIGAAGGFSNRYIDDDSGYSPLHTMHFQDADALYAYLEKAVANDTDSGWQIAVPTKVTLKNGRSYYRQYYMGRNDVELLWPLFSSEEYLRAAFCLDPEMLRDCKEFSLQRLGNGEKLRRTDFARGMLEGIMEAYNQDVLEDPEGAFWGEGRRLACMAFVITDKSGSRVSVSINVSDTMERTVEALRNAGFGEWVSVIAPAELTSVMLELPVGLEEDLSAGQRISIAREYYGVPEAGTEDALHEDAESIVSAETREDWEYGARRYAVEITDPAQIAELLELLDYAEPSRGERLFQEGCIEIPCTDKEGNQYQRLYLKKGVLPEKYILMFGESS